MAIVRRVREMDLEGIIIAEGRALHAGGNHLGEDQKIRIARSPKRAAGAIREENEGSFGVKEVLTHLMIL